MKKILMLCITVALLLGLAACSAEISGGGSLPPGEPPRLPTFEAQPISFEEYLQQLPSEEKNWLNLRTGEYVADFDAYYRLLQENYPYFGVARRLTGEDPAEVFQELRKRVAVCDNDDAYYDILLEFEERLDGAGHLSVYGPGMYFYQISSTQEFIEQYPEYADQFGPYLEALQNPLSQANYEAMNSFYRNIDALVEEANAGISAEQPVEEWPEQEEQEEPADWSNVSTQLYEDERIAYVKIESFNMGSFSADAEILLPFYEQVRDYDYLLIDITDNPGGGMNYFNMLVVAPNIAAPLSVPTYQFIKAGENNLNMLQLVRELETGLWRPADQLPDLPYMNADDLADLDYFLQEDYTIEPLEAGLGFGGEIFLLVNGNNYSSSEYAAMFSKHSGFATLVGQTTGGDGIGTDPVYLVLPYSGLIVQYSPIYGATADGRSSEEFGTEPDIVCAPDVHPYEYCIEMLMN